MLIKHKFLSEQLEGKTHQKKSIRRIVGMHHIEPALYKDVRANDETGRGEVAIFHNISKERLQFNQEQIHPINVHTRSLFKQLQRW